MIEEFLEYCEKLSLKNEGLKHCQLILNNNSPEELDIENYNHINLKFKSYSLIVDELKIPVIRTSFDIFKHDTNIGYFELDTDINGGFLDEYFVIN